jgi:hypothetical protein
MGLSNDALSIETIQSVDDGMSNEYEASGGIGIGRGNRSIPRKSVPVPLFHDKSHMT